MPRKGWRKPPGYGGYQRSATRPRRAGSPSAGPHLLLGGDATADIDEAASTPAIAESTQETEPADVDTSAEPNTRSDDGLISSRLRQRDLHEMVQSAGDEGVNTIDGSNSPPPESDDDSSDDDEVAFQPHGLTMGAISERVFF